MIAREKGLGPLADMIRLQMMKQPVEQEAKAFLSDQVETVEDALLGARDVIAESIADDADFRTYIRKIYMGSW